MSFLSRLAVSVISIVGANIVTAADAIPFYNYFDAPFATPEGGIAKDLTDYLNGKLAGKFTLHLSNVQRSKLNYAVLNNPEFKGVLAFTNPLFVGDDGRTKYNWTESVMSDQAEVVSTPAKSIDYKGDKAALKGLTGGTILGFVYKPLEPELGTAIKREDSSSDEKSLEKLLSGKIDFAIMNQSAIRYLQTKQAFAGKLYDAKTPISKITRHLMVSKNAPAGLYEALSAIVKDMPNDPKWKAILGKYGQ
jgi:ABC-type amino acid transport substrate-binding protein